MLIILYLRFYSALSSRRLGHSLYVFVLPDPIDLSVGIPKDNFLASYLLDRQSQGEEVCVCGIGGLRSERSSQRELATSNGVPERIRTTMC